MLFFVIVEIIIFSYFLEIIPNRLSVPIQTELYLEELMDKVEEKDCDVQTDEFLDRPPTPLFIPAATGVHVGTQIEPNEVITKFSVLKLCFFEIHVLKLK